MVDNTPVTPPPMPKPDEGESLDYAPGVETTGSLFKKEQGSDLPHEDVPFKMDNKQLIRGMLIVLIITLFFLLVAFLLFRPQLEQAATLFVY